MNIFRTLANFAQIKIVPNEFQEACVGSIESHADDDFVMIKSNVISSSIEELKNFKVVGSTYNNILVAVDITAQGGPDCFAIKVSIVNTHIIFL